MARTPRSVTLVEATRRMEIRPGARLETESGTAIRACALPVVVSARADVTCILSSSITRGSVISLSLLPIRIHSATCTGNRRVSMGLVIYASQPAARAFWSSPVIANENTAMTGIACSRGSAFNRRSDAPTHITQRRHPVGPPTANPPAASRRSAAAASMPDDPIH